MPSSTDTITGTAGAANADGVDDCQSVGATTFLRAFATYRQIVKGIFQCEELWQHAGSRYLNGATQRLSSVICIFACVVLLYVVRAPAMAYSWL